MQFNSIEEILAKCEKIKGKKFFEIFSYDFNNNETKDKGLIGNLIQKEVFGIEINNKSAPDFENLGIELKVTAVIKKRKDNEGREYRIKERVSLSMINYQKIIEEINFYKSHLFEKIQKTLYIFYSYDNDKPKRDWKIIDFKYKDLENDSNIQEIIDDYELICQNILSGEAHNLSESLTKKLGACTKGDGKREVVQPNSPILAKRRAFSWKIPYLSEVFYSEQIIEKEKIDTISFIKEKIKPFINSSIEEIYKKLDIRIPNSKNIKHNLIKKILNIDDYSEIPNIKKNFFRIKNIEFKNNHKIKEQIGLENVNSEDFIKNIEFEETDLYFFLSAFRFLFIVWEKIDNRIILAGLETFNFSKEILENAEFVYNDTKNKFLNGIHIYEKNNKNYNNLISKKENKSLHIRPHGRNREDTMKTPFGQIITKQQYWLNSEEVEKELRK